MKKLVFLVLSSVILFKSVNAMVTKDQVAQFNTPRVKLSCLAQIFDPKDYTKVLSRVVNDKICKVNSGNCSMDIAINEVLSHIITWFQERFDQANKKSLELVLSSKTVTDTYEFIEQKEMEIAKLKLKIKETYDQISSTTFPLDSMLSKTYSLLEDTEITLSSAKNTFEKTLSLNVCQPDEINLYIKSSASTKIENLFINLFSKELDLSNPSDQEIISLFINQGILFIFSRESENLSTTMGSRFSLVMTLVNQSSKQLKDIYEKSIILLNSLLTTLRNFEILSNQNP